MPSSTSQTPLDTLATFVDLDNYTVKSLLLINLPDLSVIQHTKVSDLQATTEQAVSLWNSAKSLSELQTASDLQLVRLRSTGHETFLLGNSTYLLMAVMER